YQYLPRPPRFAGSRVSASRRIIGAGESVKIFSPGAPTSPANIIARASRSPVRSIGLTRTGSTSGSASREPRSDSSRPYEHAYSWKRSSAGVRAAALAWGRLGAGFIEWMLILVLIRAIIEISKHRRQ